MRRGGNLARYAPLSARTPMPSRTAPIPRSAALERPWPLLRAAGSAETTRQPGRKTAARTETGFSRKTKLQVRTRAGNGSADDAMCEACGAGLGRRHGECQHLVARGMGGTSNPLLSTTANAALLCRDCHRTAESRDREMGARGFWLPQGTDPRLVPMMLASEHGSGVLVWRGVNGEYLFEAPEGVAA